MNLLVTGCCGFIGSNFVKLLLAERPGFRRPAPTRSEVPRPARSEAPREAAFAADPPSADQAFEDRLKRFMQESDSRIADNRLYADRSRGRRRR